MENTWNIEGTPADPTEELAIQIDNHMECIRTGRERKLHGH